MRAASRDRGIGSVQQGCATHPAPRKGVARSALLQHKCEEDIRMKLYERDFSEAITQTEKDALREEISFEERKGLKHLSDAPRFAHPDPDVRVFLWRNRSMFPNNYLDPVSIRNENLEELSENYVAALDAASNERDIQHYIWKDKNGIFLVLFARSIILGTTVHTFSLSRPWARNMPLIICCLARIPTVIALF